MGIVRKLCICVLAALMVFLPGCNDFHTANINLYDVDISEVKATSTAAYYLGEDGTLYCTGADSDGASYVQFQDRENGIVAENVKSFDEMIGGGFYIDASDDLYMWNRDAWPLFGYACERQHTKILNNILFASFDGDHFIYLDKNHDLYLVGKFQEEIHPITQPKLLGKNVVSADTYDRTILWTESDGTIKGYGTIEADVLESLNSKFADSDITDIQVERNYITVLSDGVLWFYGDYEKLINGIDSLTESWTLLAQDISKVSCAFRTVMALDNQGNAMLWGRCISNGLENTSEPEYSYYEAMKISDNTDSIFVSDSSVCYVDSEGKSNIFYAGGWNDFYGNSTDDNCVGINRSPCTWIEN